MTNKLLLIVIGLQLVIAGEIALTADWSNPIDAVCAAVDNYIPCDTSDESDYHLPPGE